MRLVFEDDFNGPAGAAPDSALWRHQTGGGGWGHSELQTYVNDRQHSYQDGAGRLVIRADLVGGTWRSARITTRGTARPNWALGRFEALIKMPKGKGLWPAFWLVGDAPGMPWPTDGEIDVVECVDGVPSMQHCTVHTVGKDGKHRQEAVGVTSGLDLAKSFNLYSAEWTKDQVEFRLNGARVATLTKAMVEKSGGLWTGHLDQVQCMLLNVAVGGNWAGAPAPGVTSGEMVVDWVRVWQ